MKNSNLYNSKIFKFFDHVLRLVLINLLILIPSFLFLYLFSIFFPSLINSKWSILTLIPLVLYLYPAICCGCRLVIRYELKLTNLVFKEFFKAFKKLYLKALIETCFLLLIILLFGNSLIYFYNNLSSGGIYVFGFLLTVAFTAFIGVIIIHLPLVMTYMEGCGVIDDIKLALLMAFKDLGISLAIVAFIAFMVFLCIMNDTVLIIGGFSLPIYLLVKLTFKKYYIVYLRSKKDFEDIENEKNN